MQAISKPGVSNFVDTLPDAVADEEVKEGLKCSICHSLLKVLLLMMIIMYLHHP